MLVYKFYKPDCVACNRLSIVLKQVKDLEVVSLNIEEDPSLVEIYGLTSVPTLVSEDGRKLIGLKTAREIMEWLA